MLKIAIDNKPLVSGHRVRGVGRYTKELIASLNKVSFGKLKYSAVDTSKVNLSNYDVIHLPFFNPITSRLPETDLSKVVITIHDLIPMIYPKVYQAGIGGYINLAKQKRLLRNVGKVIVPSETSKKDVIRLLGIPAEKVQVVYESYKTIFKKISDKTKLAKTKKKFNLPDKFVLYVGDINFNKNIPTLVEACSLVSAPLVICGKQALDIDDFGINLMNLKGPRDWLRFLFDIPHPEVSHHGLLGEKFRKYKQIKRLGYVADDELVQIYNLAGVYVQPSLYEGFGLSVLEAMACQTPVIVSRTNALVEIAGNASLVSTPTDAKDFARNIKRVLTKRKLTNSLIKAGEARSEEFTWDKTARETIEVYKEVSGKTD